MFIWPWALVHLIGRASFLMNFQEEKKKKVPHPSSDGTLSVLLLFVASLT